MRGKLKIVLAFGVGTILGSAGMRLISETSAATATLPPPVIWEAVAVATASPNNAWFVGSNGAAQTCVAQPNPSTPFVCYKIPLILTTSPSPVVWKATAVATASPINAWFVGSDGSAQVCVAQPNPSPPFVCYWVPFIPSSVSGPPPAVP